MTEEKDDESISPEQLEYFLKTFPGIYKFVSRKLGAAHRSSAEDVVQRVFLKLWRWKKGQLANYKNGNGNSENGIGKTDKIDLSAEEWQKMAKAVARNEVIDFFREKYTRRDVVFSQTDEETRERIFSVPDKSPDQNPEGNSRAEMCSQLKLIWKAAQALSSVRQKYTYFLQFRDFIIEFIVCGCCSIEELAVYLETDENGLNRIISELPLTDEEIRRLIEKNFGEKLAPKQIWEARAKAKKKLARKLAEYISDERLFIQKGS